MKKHLSITLRAALFGAAVTLILNPSPSARAQTVTTISAGEHVAVNNANPSYAADVLFVSGTLTLSGTLAVVSTNYLDVQSSGVLGGDGVVISGTGFVVNGTLDVTPNQPARLDILTDAFFVNSGATLRFNLNYGGLNLMGWQAPGTFSISDGANFVFVASGPLDPGYYSLLSFGYGSSDPATHFTNDSEVLAGVAAARTGLIYDLGNGMVGTLVANDYTLKLLVEPVPEPGVTALIISGLAGLALLARWRR